MADEILPVWRAQSIVNAAAYDTFIAAVPDAVAGRRFTDNITGYTYEVVTPYLVNGGVMILVAWVDFDADPDGITSDYHATWFDFTNVTFIPLP